MGMDLATLSIAIDSTGVRQGNKDLKDLKSTAGDVEKSMGALESAFLRVVSAIGLMRTADYVKDTALLAARYETLGVAMNTIGATAGYTKSDLYNYENALQRTGIAALGSRESIVKLIAANVDLNKAAELGRAAQNIAIINNLNSTEAFNKMVQGIQTGQVRLLHTMGIMGTFQEAYKKFGAEVGKSAAALTDFEKVQARTNMVLEYAAKLSGAYEAAMGTAGKQLRTMERYTEDLRVKMGEAFGPSLVTIVSALNGEFQKMSDSVSMSKVTGEFKGWQNTLQSLTRVMIYFVSVAFDIGKVLLVVATGFLAMKGYTWAVAMWDAISAAMVRATAVTLSFNSMTMMTTATMGVAKAATLSWEAVLNATGGKVGLIITVVAVLISAFAMFSNETEKNNQKVMEAIQRTSQATSSYIEMANTLKAAAAAHKDNKDAVGGSVEGYSDLERAKLKIMGMGPEFNNTLITEAKNVKELSEAYNLLAQRDVQAKIAAAEALKRSLEGQLSKIGPGLAASLKAFLDAPSESSSPFDKAAEKSAQRTRDNLNKATAERGNEVRLQIAAANKELSLLVDAMEKLQNIGKGTGMKTPDETENENAKKAREARDAARSAEDLMLQLRRDTLSASKAITDEEKRTLAIKLAEIDLEVKIKDLRRQFADGKVAGGSERLKELIDGYKTVLGLKTDSANRVFDETQDKKKEDALKKIAEAYDRIQAIEGQVDSVSENGWSKKINETIFRFDKFEQDINKFYKEMDENAKKAGKSIAEMYPQLSPLAAMLDKITKNRKVAVDTATAKEVEEAYNKIVTKLKEIETKQGALTLDEAIAAARVYAKEMGMIPAAVKKLEGELTELDRRAGRIIPIVRDQRNVWLDIWSVMKSIWTWMDTSWLGGMKAGFRDWGKDATDIFGTMRKNSMKWMDDMSSRLTQVLMGGKFEFKEFARSILADLTQMLVKMALFNAIKAGLGGLGYDTSWMGGTRASGGGVQSGRPYLVGENGPELFVPPGSGTIQRTENSFADGGTEINIIFQDSGGTSTNSKNASPQKMDFAKMVGQMVKQAIAEEKRLGNMLNPVYGN